MEQANGYPQIYTRARVLDVRELQPTVLLPAQHRDEKAALLRRMPVAVEGGTRQGAHDRVSEVFDRGVLQARVHYGRNRRGVPDQSKTHAYRYTTQTGYVVLLDAHHPLAMKDGRVHEHRAVAYKAHEGQCPSCFWCAARLTWPDAVIDHLDEDKKNNEPANLVVACNPCNRARGAMLPFIAGLTEKSLQVFIERVKAYRLTVRS
jgi:hypothetical protein